MKYVALLRGINVGKGRSVPMAKLKTVIERAGGTHVSTYINSGNVLFASSQSKGTLQSRLTAMLKKEFGFAIPTLIKTTTEMRKIAQAIPTSWLNDAKQRTDVAYLFDAIDSKKTLNDLPLDRTYSDVRYVPGAIIWNIKRKHVYQSKVVKVIAHKIYQEMTIRNVNTARFLGR